MSSREIEWRTNGVTKQVNVAPVDCRRCGDEFLLPFPPSGNVQPNEWLDHLVELYEPIVDIDAQVSARCPSCGERYSYDDYRIKTARAKTEGMTRPDVCLLSKCECCSTLLLTLQKDRCRICDDYGTTGHEILEKEGVECELCERLFLERDLVEHHTSYVPEEVIEVCNACHGKIHNSSDTYSDLEPDMKREEWEQEVKGWGGNRVEY